MLEKRKMLSTKLTYLYFIFYILLLVFTFDVSTFGLAFRPEFIPSFRYFV